MRKDGLPMFGVSLNLGGTDGITGDGGHVVVTTNGSVTTQGRNAHAVLAQSIGGGGGLWSGSAQSCPERHGLVRAAQAAVAASSKSNCKPTRS
jgi:hypothetical protein